ncbi:MAG: hypothetical protein JWP89_2244 [Schlesneria sp.]|nr:hypothetical protein [Schlesneria sp.]
MIEQLKCGANYQGLNVSAPFTDPLLAKHAEQVSTYYTVYTYITFTTVDTKQSGKHINHWCSEDFGIQRRGMLQSATFVTISPSAQRGIGKKIYWNRRNSLLNGQTARSILSWKHVEVC